jgi:hypothetical protein
VSTSGFAEVASTCGAGRAGSGFSDRPISHILQSRVAQPQCCLEPFERLGPIAPLRVDLGVLVRRGIAQCRLHFRKLGFRVCMASKLVIDYREAQVTPPVVLLRLA